MTVSSITLHRDRELLLCAVRQLEQVYFQQQNSCLALSIARNYRLLSENTPNLHLQKEWKNKEKLWWQVYRKE